jgi:hypothetical protein
MYLSRAGVDKNQGILSANGRIMTKVLDKAYKMKKWHAQI